MIPNHLHYQIQCVWFAKSSIIWFHCKSSLPVNAEIVSSNSIRNCTLKSNQIKTVYTDSENICWGLQYVKEHSCNWNLHGLGAKEQMLISNFSKTLSQCFPFSLISYSYPETYACSSFGFNKNWFRYNQFNCSHSGSDTYISVLKILSFRYLKIYTEG